VLQVENYGLYGSSWVDELEVRLMGWGKSGIKK